MYLNANDLAVLRYHMYALSSACNDLAHLLPNSNDEDAAHMCALAKELSSTARRVWLDTRGPRVTE